MAKEMTEAERHMAADRRNEIYSQLAALKEKVVFSNYSHPSEAKKVTRREDAWSSNSMQGYKVIYDPEGQKTKETKQQNHVQRPKLYHFAFLSR